MLKIIFYSVFLFLIAGCGKEKQIPLPELGEYFYSSSFTVNHFPENPDSTWLYGPGGGTSVYIFYNHRDIKIENFHNNSVHCDSTRLKICSVDCSQNSCSCKREFTLCVTEINDDSISFINPVAPIPGINGLKIGYNKKTKTYEGWEEGRGLERVGQVGQYRMYVWKARVTLKKVE
jgi:hypothetical protein